MNEYLTEEVLKKAKRMIELYSPDSFPNTLIRMPESHWRKYYPEWFD